MTSGMLVQFFFPIWLPSAFVKILTQEIHCMSIAYHAVHYLFFFNFWSIHIFDNSFWLNIFEEICLVLFFLCVILSRPSTQAISVLLKFSPSKIFSLDTFFSYLIYQFINNWKGITACFKISTLDFIEARKNGKHYTVTLSVFPSSCTLCAMLLLLAHCYDREFFR